MVSGHGSSDSNPLRSDGNWESSDKIYLLRNGEIFSYCLISNCYDTVSYSYNGSGSRTTRQLDYYYSKGTNNNSTSEAIKKYNGTNTR